MSDEDSGHVVQDTLQKNVSAFEAIYDRYWDKKEDLAKLLITLSSTFIVIVASVMKAFYPGNLIPGQFVVFLVLLIVPAFLGCLALWYLADLRSLKVVAFETRYRSKGVFDACFVGDEPTIRPFTELVFEVLGPARQKDRTIGRILAAGYIVFFTTFLVLGVGLGLDELCS